MLIGIFDPMGAQSDCLQCEVCQNLILSSMNTGFLRYAVATVLTVYGIETCFATTARTDFKELQQCLPFTVLKQAIDYVNTSSYDVSCNSAYRLRY